MDFSGFDAKSTYDLRLRPQMLYDIMRNQNKDIMYINRDFEECFAKILRSGKVLVIYGSRQTGKTTLVEKLLENEDIKKERVVVLNGDIRAHCELLNYETMTPAKAQSIVGTAKTLFVDEAQKILDIGLTLKIIHDNLKGIRIVATGSSSFELSEEVGEPLTGRMAGFTLPPLSFGELAAATDNAAEISRLGMRLRLGAYPDVVTASTESEAIENLSQLCEAYLFKDVLKWQNVKNSEMLSRLLKALALQIGNEVSYKEVGDIVGIDNETVQAYIERLEKAFVVFRLSAFARNLRNELKKSRKVYFCDTGVRNAVLGNFLQLDCRDDVGHLFENYLICERMKYNNLKRRRVRSYFWRTTTPGDGEIDYVEESVDGGIKAYEFKYSPEKAAKARCPARFASAYPDAVWMAVSKGNFVEFVNGQI